MSLHLRDSYNIQYKEIQYMFEDQMIRIIVKFSLFFTVLEIHVLLHFCFHQNLNILWDILKYLILFSEHSPQNSLSHIPP